MVYLGIDQHKNYSTITAIDEKNSIKTEKIRNYPDELKECIKRMTNGKKGEAVIEAGRNCYVMYDFLLQNTSINRVIISNPIKTKAIASAKIKTDTIDSKILAYLLKANLIPEVYVPPKEVRQQKDLLRTRAFLIKIRTMMRTKFTHFTYRK